MNTEFRHGDKVVITGQREEYVIDSFYLTKQQWHAVLINATRSICVKTKELEKVK